MVIKCFGAGCSKSFETNEKIKGTMYEDTPFGWAIEGLKRKEYFCPTCSANFDDMFDEDTVEQDIDFLLGI